MTMRFRTLRGGSPTVGACRRASTSTPRSPSTPHGDDHKSLDVLNRQIKDAAENASDLGYDNRFSLLLQLTTFMKPDDKNVVACKEFLFDVIMQLPAQTFDPNCARKCKQKMTNWN